MGIEKSKRLAKILNYFIPKSNCSPYFLVVGAQKAATTSLHYYLDQHPGLYGSKPKEINFFDRDEIFAKGRKWYENHFKRDKKSFESTPEYLYRSYAAQRIYNLYPKMRIVIVLREPISRAFSAWNMYKQFGEEHIELPNKLYTGYRLGSENQLLKNLYQDKFPPFNDIVRKEMSEINSIFEEPSFIRRGIYLPQIRRFHTFFGKENVLIIGYQDIIDSPIQVLNQILRFIGEIESDWNFLKHNIRNKRKYETTIDIRTKKNLQKFYKGYNDDLFNYLGYQINW